MTSITGVHSKRSGTGRRCPFRFKRWPPQIQEVAPTGWCGTLLCVALSSIQDHVIQEYLTGLTRVITSIYMASVRVMVEHNPAELRDLTVSTHFSFEMVRDRRLKN